MARSLGRFRTRDVPCHGVQDSAQKTLIASYHGSHYVAERNGDALEIYSLHDEFGMPATETRTTSDRRPKINSIADLNRHNAALRPRRV